MIWQRTHVRYAGEKLHKTDDRITFGRRRASWYKVFRISEMTVKQVNNVLGWIHEAESYDLLFNDIFQETTLNVGGQIARGIARQRQSPTTDVCETCTDCKPMAIKSTMFMG